ncbi:ArsR/SmtB family transcription factor [Kallotenue papyrolyticum]|uniref:ArsR/SmtB family transcription factor n=1 Tax=Kallotenue papyrolyticum TaxID=1325125 RepID=UPI0004785709|nr:metalloregulator ArsR/SmtB family transcription factor [Kallotenue papyrolyticum]
MAELIRGRPALTSEWLVSVGLDLLSTASLVTMAHDFEGLGTWLLEAWSAMPPRLRQDLELSLRLTGYPQTVVETVVSEVLDQHPAGHERVEALFADLAALDAAACAHMADAILAKSLARREIQPPLPLPELRQDLEALETVIHQLQPPVVPAEAAALLHTPTEWRDLLLSALQRFWERIYRQQWERTREQLERSVNYHRRRSYPSDVAALFQAVTGRQIPERMRVRLDEVEHIRFVPSLYLGPYVSFLFNGAVATIFYNGEGTPVDESAVPQIEDLYHPLTALADKTRLAILAMLSGRELYAQEIVDRLGISQSAVSRHLQLMVDMKVLNVRRGERGAKYYSINSATLQRVAQRLSEFG